MDNKNATLKICVFLFVAISPLLLGKHILLANPVVSRSTPSSLELLGNGNYQFCSKPKPQNGNDGDGVCFVFSKIGERIDGYYGYPHSQMYVCVKGQAEGNRVFGYGLVLSWSTITTSEYTWRLDRHLTLQNGYVVRSQKRQYEELYWIKFDDLNLNIDGFYQYPIVKMQSSSQLCDWEISSDRVSVNSLY